MGWTETPSLSFTARHEDSESDAALSVLESLERYRVRLEELFPRVPANVTVVLHDSELQLAFAQPYISLARRLSAAPGRRYVAGWFGRGEIHCLAPSLLRRSAAGPESLDALVLTPQRAYTMLVIGVNNGILPPPFSPFSTARLLRLSWLVEGGGQFWSGQVPHLRAAISRRLRGRTPRFPPSLRDATLLGGSLYDLLLHERGMEACVRLALDPRPGATKQMIEDAFGSSFSDVRLRWRAHLEQLAKPRPDVRIDPDR